MNHIRFKWFKIWSFEHSWGRVLNGALHLHKKGFKLLTHWSVQKILCLIDNLFGDTFADKELTCFISEVITVVINHMIFFGCVFVCNFIQIIFKNFSWNLGFSHFNFFNRFSIWCLFWMIMTNSSTKIVLFSVDDEWRVVDSIDLLSDKHHAETFGHTVCYVVQCKGNFFWHFF